MQSCPGQYFSTVFFSAATAHPPLVQFLSVLTLFYNSSQKNTGFLTPANGKNESESTIFFIKGVFGYTAGSVGWFISLLVREEVLLAGLCEKNIVPTENLRSFTTSHSQTNRLIVSITSDV